MDKIIIKRGVCVCVCLKKNKGLNYPPNDNQSVLTSEQSKWKNNNKKKEEEEEEE